MLMALLLVKATLLMAVTSEEAVRKFVNTCGIRPESVAVMIVNLADGDTLGQHNTSMPLLPASIMKAVTTATLLEKASADYRYHTPIYIDGPLDMGILRGNLIVEGACDPSVNSAVEPFGQDIIEEITDALRLAGITKIEGNVLIDETAYGGTPRPASWHPSDFKEAYGTGIHTFNFENNANGRKSVENPSRVFMSRLKRALSAEMITIDGKDLGEGKRTLLFDHVSPPVDEIMRSCMMRSDNMFAEAMLRTYGKLEGKDGSTETAATRELAYWTDRDMPMEGVEIIDGSGLSRSNRVTADFMTGMLGVMGDNATYASFFPLAGQEGTLKSFLAETPLDSYIAMKTGSMKGVQCYAGYKVDENYMPTHSVVIIMNDITGSRSKAKKAAETMLLEIFCNESNIKENE
jgi:D-alanyl-D-alanine carboxypeptidase/D-alanyl-D-alanine-endopeptidase (penicillin-binding protein 4)